MSKPILDKYFEHHSNVSLDKARIDILEKKNERLKNDFTKLTVKYMKVANELSAMKLKAGVL